MEGSTDLGDLLGSAPVQNLPQSTTYAPMVTGGGDPFSTPISTRAPAPSVQSSPANFSYIRYAFKNLVTYLGFFVATVIVSLSTPRNLILQYIPNSYASGGILSYSGAAILGGVAVVLAYVFSVLVGSIL